MKQNRNEIFNNLRDAYLTNPLFQHLIDFAANKVSSSVDIVLDEVPAASLKTYQEINDHLTEKQTITNIMKDYWLYGESFVYTQLNEVRSIWDEFLIQNPAYVVVKHTLSSENQYYLRPDEKLRNAIFSDKEGDKKQVQKLDTSVVECVKNKQNIPLNQYYFTAFMRKVNAYDLRGTSIFAPYLSDLLEQKNDEIEKIFHPEKVEGFVSKELLSSRYNNAISHIVIWLNNKIFAPIAKMNDFYCWINGTKCLAMPKIESKAITF